MLFDTDDHAWVENSAAKQGAEVDVAFLIKSTFYKGDPKRFFENRHDTVPLPVPAAASCNDGYCNLNSKDVVGHESDLAAHYNAVLELARKYGQAPTSILSHFWLHLDLKADDVTVRFAWRDWWEEILSFLDWAESAEEGDGGWYDVEQGWELFALLHKDRFHLRVGDLEREFENFSMPKEALQASIVELKGRMPRIINRLIGEVGKDYWTKYPR